jgi:arylformamidase
MTDVTLSRRKFIASSFLLATASPLVFGNQDKAIYNGWDLKQLNDQIGQGPYITNFQKTADDFYAESLKYRAAHPPKTYAYGTGARDNLDVYAPANAKGLPIMIWIFGGEWKFGSKNDYASASPNFINANAIYIPIDYQTIPPNNISGIIDQCRKAIAWVYKNAAQIGGDPSKIYVSGHSAGGHLTNMMACTDWKKHQLPANVIKGCVVMSGWTDLYPISLTDRQEYLKLTPEDIKKYSPINLLSNVSCPMIISFGSLESPYMRGQSSAWAQKLQSVGKLAGIYSMQNRDHLQMPMQYVDKDNQLFKATLALMDII